MTAAERLATIQVKIDRAKLRFAEVSQLNASFFSARPFRVEHKRDVDSKRLIYFLSTAPAAPIPLMVTAGEVLHSLRSALDHLAYHLVQVGTGNPGPHPRAQFPMFDSFAKYMDDRRAKKSRLSGMRQAALAEFDALRPYAGGRDILWRLDKLNNIDKHRVLLTAGAAYRSVNIAPSIAEHLTGFSQAATDLMRRMNIPLLPADRMFPLMPGMSLFADAPDAKPIEMQFKFELAFNEPPVCVDLPVLNSLDEMISEVQQVTVRFLPHLS